MGGQPWGISTSHALQYNVIFVRCCSSVVTCNYPNAAECAAYKTACYCSNAAMCICCCTWHVPTSASICNHWNKSFFMCCCCYCMCCSFATAACAVAWLCFIVAVAHAGHTRSSLQVLWHWQLVLHLKRPLAMAGALCMRYAYFPFLCLVTAKWMLCSPLCWVD